MRVHTEACLFSISIIYLNQLRGPPETQFYEASVPQSFIVFCLVSSESVTSLVYHLKFMICTSLIFLHLTYSSADLPELLSNSVCYCSNDYSLKTK